MGFVVLFKSPKGQEIMKGWLNKMTKVINGKEYKLHHVAAANGYVSRKSTVEKKQEYNGKFGKGYVIYLPRYDTNRYCYVEYWIETGKGGE